MGQGLLEADWEDLAHLATEGDVELLQTAHTLSSAQENYKCYMDIPIVSYTSKVSTNDIRNCVGHSLSLDMHTHIYIYIYMHMYIHSVVALLGE